MISAITPLSYYSNLGQTILPCT